MKVRPLLPLSLFVVLFATPSTYLPLAAQSTARAPRVGRSAPNFERLDLSHRKVELSSYRGKVVLLNFWATWCAPCLTEMPTFAAWQSDYRSENFQVIGISMDDAAPEVIATVAKLKPTYPILMGDERLGAAYGGILGLPVTFLIDRGGTIRARYQSADLAKIRHDIDRLLRAR